MNLVEPARARPEPAFAGADICTVAGLPVRRGQLGPRFEQDRWDFTVVDQLPRSISRGVLIWDFREIHNPRWRILAKEYLTALCSPAHERVRVLPSAHRVPRTVRTCHDRFQQLTRWLNCLTAQGVTSLEEVTQHHSTVHLAHRCAGRDADTARSGPVRDPHNWSWCRCCRKSRTTVSCSPRTATRAAFVPGEDNSPTSSPGCRKTAARTRHLRPAPRS